MSAPAIARPTNEDQMQVGAQEAERPLLAQVEQFLADQPAHATALIGRDGQRIALPPSVYAVLQRTVQMLARGDVVAITPAHTFLSTNEAADLLNVSRPYLVQLLNRGEIPFTMVGTHHRIAFGDVMAYRQRRDATRRAALTRLAKMSEELGLYDR